MDNECAKYRILTCEERPTRLRCWKIYSAIVPEELHEAVQLSDGMMVHRCMNGRVGVTVSY